MLPSEARDDLIRRLRRIEGQTQGIQRMLAEGRDCQEILHQLASVRAATRSVSLELMRHHMTACIGSSGCVTSEQRIDEMINLLLHI